MAIQTKQITTGDHQNVRVQKEDLDILKKFQSENENLAVTFHRVVTTYELYEEILKSGSAIHRNCSEAPNA